MKSVEERLTDLERRFYPLEELLYQMYETKIEEIKEKDIKENGLLFKVKYKIETDKGLTDIVVDVRAYTDKQALFFSNRDVIYPNMNRLQSEGKISWFKTISKEIIK